MNDQPVDGDRPASSPEAEAAPAPARKRTRKAAAASAETAAPAAEAAVPAAGDEAPAKPARKRRTTKAAAEAAPEAAPVEAASAPVEAPQPVEQAAVADGGDAEGGPEGEGGADGERRGRRGRNRRRGRGGEGGPAGADGQQTVPTAAVAAEAANERFADVLSDNWDTETAAEEAPVAASEGAEEAELGKRVLRPEPEAPKLHKVLAQSGIGSRRDMEQLIADGRVTVNDEVAHLGMRITFGDQIKVNGKPVKVRIAPPPARVLAYHKPVGEVVTFNDPEGRPTVFRSLPRLANGKWQSVGRLDINTEGLLLFTTSGELANQLMHPRFGVEREYAVRVLGTLESAQRAQLLEGVEIDGQSAAFKSIEDGGGEGVNRWYRVVITEGRNREVRKLFDKVGLGVSRLIRIRYGTVVLPRGLKRGVWVELDDNDVRSIRRLAHPGGGQPQQPQPQRQQQGGGKGAQQQRGKGRGERNGDRNNERNNERNDRGPRGNRQGGQGGQGEGRRDEPPRVVGEDGGFEEDFGRIPNPLEQTFDRRFAKGGRRGPAQGFGHAAAQRDDDVFAPPGTIPNPLEQTFDRRFAKGNKRITAGFGRPDSNAPQGDQQQGRRGGGGGGGPKQPDPMKTSVGYIGADAYFNKGGGKGGGGRRGGGGGGNRGGRGR